MNWSLAPLIAGTRVGGDLVFLDLELDHYTCLPRPLGLTLNDRQVTAETLDAARPLIEAGYLGTPPLADDANRAPPARATADLPVVQSERLAFCILRDFIFSWLETLTRRPGKSLLALHLQIRNDNPDREPRIDDVASRVALFERLAPWVPFPGACMFRSYMLLRFLQRGGLDARWVIGVRTWPFDAHCWLQIGATALDDRCERLVRFEPLLAI